jgi:hypothetical protein
VIYHKVKSEKGETIRRIDVKKTAYILMAGIASFVLASCTTRYVVKPLPFKAPSAYPNVQEVAGALIGARVHRIR